MEKPVSRSNWRWYPPAHVLTGAVGMTLIGFVFAGFGVQELLSGSDRVGLGVFAVATGLLMAALCATGLILVATGRMRVESEFMDVDPTGPLGTHRCSCGELVHTH